MLFEPDMPEQRKFEGAVGADHHGPKDPAKLTERRVLLIAADAVMEDRALLERAEKLRSALGLELRFLPAAPTHGDPFTALLSESALAEVALIVVRGPQRHPDGSRDPRWHAFLRCCQRPLFIAREPQDKLDPDAPSVVVAASECSDPSLPVVREARIIAAALSSKLLLVHNVDPIASQFAERVGLPMSTPLADMLAQRLREQLEAVGDGEVVVTREEDNARAVLSIASARQAELVVVGVKPPLASTHGTADAVFDAAQQSLLLIPLFAARHTALLD